MRRFVQVIVVVHRQIQVRHVAGSVRRTPDCNVDRERKRELFIVAYAGGNGEVLR